MTPMRKATMRKAKTLAAQASIPAPARTTPAPATRAVHLIRTEYGRPLGAGAMCGLLTKVAPVIADHGSPQMCGACLASWRANPAHYPSGYIGALE